MQKFIGKFCVGIHAMGILSFELDQRSNIFDIRLEYFKPVSNSDVFRRARGHYKIVLSDWIIFLILNEVLCSIPNSPVI